MEYESKQEIDIDLEKEVKKYIHFASTYYDEDKKFWFTHVNYTVSCGISKELFLDQPENCAKIIVNDIKQKLLKHFKEAEELLNRIEIE